MLILGRISIYVVLSSIISDIGTAEFKIVDTRNGPVRGVRKLSLLKNVPFYSFKGIPFAKPPVGDLRFKAPEPVESWAPNVLDATKPGTYCIPNGRFLKRPLPDGEDCLNLNVYVPADADPNQKMAVLFYIHGGGFNEGSSDDIFYGPDFIVEKQTILVSTNYRLGVLGFLSLDTPEYSGNMALKDQQLALKWTSENIERFGGDNKRITVFGHSAGGASTGLQVLSAESRKYFRNAVPMSGNAGTYWVVTHDDHLKWAFRIAEDLGMPQKSREELISFLKSVPARNLTRFAPTIVVRNTYTDTPMAPIVERRDAIRPFMVDEPEKVYATSNIEMDAMFTTVSQEMIPLMPEPSAAELKAFDDDFNRFLPFSEKLNISADSKLHRHLTDLVRVFYFGNASIDKKTMEILYDYMSDVNYFLGLDHGIKMHATYAKGKAYYVWTSVDSTLNAFKTLDLFNGRKLAKLPGTGHGDDVCYLFRCHAAQTLYEQVLSNPDDEQSKVSLRTIDYFTDLFTNFAKYGVPTYRGKPIDEFQPIRMNHISSLDISNSPLKIGSQPREESTTFWAQLEKLAAEAVQRGES